MTSTRREAVQNALDWFENNSGWAPPDPDTLAEWVADQVCRCPDDCLVVPESWCRHGLASWDLILQTVNEGHPPAEPPAAADGPDRLHYADAPPVEVEILIAARPSRVWALVTDLDLAARFSDEFQGAEWLDGATGPAVGARFRGRNEHPLIGSWESVSTVTAYHHGRIFSWAVGDVDAPAASWRYELEPDGRAGGVRLVHWGRIGPGPSGISPFIEQHPDREHEIVKGRLEMLRKNMLATLAGIKALAESPMP